MNRNRPGPQARSSQTGRRSGLGGENRLFRSLLGGAEVGATASRRAADAVDGGLRDQRAVELEGAAGVVIARDREIDRVRIGIGVDDGDHRNTETAGFLDG